MKVLFVNPPVIRYKDLILTNEFRLFMFNFREKFKDFPLVYNNLYKLGFGKGLRFGVRAGSRWPWTAEKPIGPVHYPFLLCYATSFLKNNGFEAKIIDAVADEQYSFKNFLNIVYKEKADIVVIECSTPTLDIDLYVAKKISEFTEVALAGPHVASYAQNLREQYPFVKYFLKGEYIKSSLKMAKSKVPGIYESEIVTDLDSIPFPFRDYPSALKYYDPTMPTPKPQLQIYASKGCPFRCTFCLWPKVMYNRIVSYRDPKMVCQEIIVNVEKHGFKSIFFDDDTFNIGTQRISLLCDGLKKIGLPWTMMGRLDTSPDWLFDKMVDSGCVGMRFGIETFDLNVLKTIQKGLEKTDFVKTLKYISNKYPKLMIHLTMMKDLPGQTEEIHLNDMKILEDLGFASNNIFRSFQLSSCVPFPGTEMYNQLIRGYDPNIFGNFKLYDGSRETVMKELKR